MINARGWSRSLALPFAFAAIPFFIACNTDARTTKGIVGVWTWNPRDVLPANKIEDKGFPTPTLESYRFDADGHYVHVRQIPGYDTDVAGKPFRVAARWHEWKGTWSITKGELAMTSGPSADGWTAHETPEGWMSDSDTTPVGDGLTYKVDALTTVELRLHAIAIGDIDRTLRKTTSMPPRPPTK